MTATATPSPVTFADLYRGSERLCRRMGLRRLHVLADDGRPIATFELRPEVLGGRIDHPTDYRPGEPAASVALVLACGRRGRR